uniref:Uncharacterized protein n=1 Tax=Anopheles melas TaxID=34690 RepID=A0A182UC87_9DIPT
MPARWFSSLRLLRSSSRNSFSTSRRRPPFSRTTVSAYRPDISSDSFISASLSRARCCSFSSRKDFASCRPARLPSSVFAIFSAGACLLADVDGERGSRLMLRCSTSWDGSRVRLLCGGLSRSRGRVDFLGGESIASKPPSLAFNAFHLALLKSSLARSSGGRSSMIPTTCGASSSSPNRLRPAALYTTAPVLIVTSTTSSTLMEATTAAPTTTRTVSGTMVVSSSASLMSIKLLVHTLPPPNPPRPPPPPPPPVLRCVCQDGISSGGGLCSYARPPLSGTRPMMCRWILLLVFLRTDALLVFSMMASVSRAASSAAMSVSRPPTSIVSSSLRFSAYRSAITPSLSLTRLDHRKLWIVTSSRVSSILRRRSYSLSRSFCSFSSLAHCSAVRRSFGLNSGLLSRFSPAFRIVSSRLALMRSNSAFGGTLFGGLPMPSVMQMSFSAAAVGDSCSVMTVDFSFGLSDSSILNAISSLIRSSFDSSVCNRSDTWPDVRLAYGQVSSFRNADSSMMNELASSLFPTRSSSLPRMRISSVSHTTMS